MNAKSKHKLNAQMTVTSHSHISSVPLSDQIIANCPKQVYRSNSNRLSVGLNPLKNSRNVCSVDSKSGQWTDGSSSIILRQKILHRNKNGSIVGTTSKSGRKSYSRSQHNGFKFHNFVVNEDKKSCLEEQHGTKKITVNHWKRNATSPVIINEDSDESISTSSPPSHSILETLLAPNTSNNHLVEDNHRVNKRKPLHVRRVLRQQHNQSMDTTEAEPQEEPLDLSFKRFDFNVRTEKSDSNEMNSRLNHNMFINETQNDSESVQHLIKSVNQSAAQASAIIASVVKCPNSVKSSSTASSNSATAQRHQQMSVNASVSAKQQKYRQTQRSLIKKQLEETFKQNGFLVKTKQVSDANNSAMFCKFRQLRKYTRYYLKSWHHHLPDEVNKLWKGFLPPKTEKPNSSHT